MKKENRTNANIRKYLGASVLSVALLLAFAASALWAALLLASGIPGLTAQSRTATLPHDAAPSGTNLSAVVEQFETSLEKFGKEIGQRFFKWDFGLLAVACGLVWGLDYLNAHRNS